jgi:hypothetical protein
MAHGLQVIDTEVFRIHDIRPVHFNNASIICAPTLSKVGQLRKETEGMDNRRASAHEHSIFSGSLSADRNA